MPKKKLTLSVDEAVIRRAKRFSRRHDTSVSRLVSEFLSRLDADPGEPTPVVSRLTGLLSPETSIDDHHRHLEEKHGP